MPFPIHTILYLGMLLGNMQIYISLICRRDKKSYGVHKITKLITVLRGKCIAVNAHIKKR